MLPSPLPHPPPLPQHPLPQSTPTDPDPLPPPLLILLHPWWSLLQVTDVPRKSTWWIPLHSPQERWLHWPPCPHWPTSCPQQQVELTVHRANKTLREQAVITDVNPKKLAAICSSSLDFEGKAKIGCSENSHGTENPSSMQPTSL